MLGRGQIPYMVGMYLFTVPLNSVLFTLLYFSLMTNVPLSYYKETTTNIDRAAFYQASGPNYIPTIPFKSAIVFFFFYNFMVSLNWMSLMSCLLLHSEVPGYYLKEKPLLFFAHNPFLTSHAELNPQLISSRASNFNQDSGLHSCF